MRYHPYRGATALYYLVPEECLPKRPLFYWWDVYDLAALRMWVFTEALRTIFSDRGRGLSRSRDIWSVDR